MTRTPPSASASYPDKESARQAVWSHLETARIARFPFPPHGRIPNFAGARQAAERLFAEEPWASARRLKVNPDAPQRTVRLMALERGITIYMPTPRLKGGFMELDPRRIPADKLKEAASLSKCARWARQVPLDDLPQMDAIITGSVAVTPGGHRCGKGEGYGDLELAILLELGHRPVPVATTVHDDQVVGGFPTDATDLPLACIVTPTRTIRVQDLPPVPRGIDWSRLSPERLEEMPILKALKDR